MATGAPVTSSAFRLCMITRESEVCFFKFSGFAPYQFLVFVVLEFGLQWAGDFYFLCVKIDCTMYTFATVSDGIFS